MLQGPVLRLWLFLLLLLLLAVLTTPAFVLRAQRIVAGDRGRGGDPHPHGPRARPDLDVRRPHVVLSSLRRQPIAAVRRRRHATVAAGTGAIHHQQFVQRTQSGQRHLKRT